MLATHIHLAISHIPVLFIPLGVSILIWGMYKQANVVKQVALGILILGAVGSVPVFYSGEEAEEVVEELSMVSESHIEEHEVAAEVAFPLTALTGVLALLALIVAKMNLPYQKQATISVLIVGLVSTVVLMWTANLGGQIRHSEIRSADFDSTQVHREAHNGKEYENEDDG